MVVFTFVMAQNPQSKKATEKWFPELEMDINTPAFQKEKNPTLSLVYFRRLFLAFHHQLKSKIKKQK